MLFRERAFLTLNSPTDLFTIDLSINGRSPTVRYLGLPRVYSERSLAKLAWAWASQGDWSRNRGWSFLFYSSPGPECHREITNGRRFSSNHGGDVRKVQRNGETLPLAIPFVISPMRYSRTSSSPVSVLSLWKASRAPLSFYRACIGMLSPRRSPPSQTLDDDSKLGVARGVIESQQE